MLPEVGQIVAVGLASGVLSLAVSEGGLFDPLRERLRGKLYLLASCALCLGAWFCAALWLWQGVPQGMAAPVAWGASWAVSTATAWGLEELHG